MFYCIFSTFFFIENKYFYRFSSDVWVCVRVGESGVSIWKISRYFPYVYYEKVFFCFCGKLCLLFSYKEKCIVKSVVFFIENNKWCFRLSFAFNSVSLFVFFIFVIKTKKVYTFLKEIDRKKYRMVVFMDIRFSVYWLLWFRPQKYCLELDTFYIEWKTGIRWMKTNC